jgi:ubiquinone/menaquinone biosynthesis C-methylase UbiE
MDPIQVFSTKAKLYDRYRWSYAPQAIEAILLESKLSKDATIADIGAGTGILTQQFTGRAGRLIAIEPNPEMGEQAAYRLAGVPNCHLLAARAENLALRDHSVDLITVATASSWFQPEAARREFNRIIKPGGWLAILHNFGTNRELGEALNPVFPPQCDTEQWMIGKCQPKTYYFGAQSYRKLVFPLPPTTQTWGDFLGALLTTSFAPSLKDPQYPRFEADARLVFEQFSEDGCIQVQAVTELVLGQIDHSR